MKNIKILLFNLIINLIYAKILQNCEISNYCGKNRTACSKNGNCNFNIFDYYKNNSTDKDKEPTCQCNVGYSSYNVKMENNDETSIHCCYKKKGMFTPFFLELFLGFGIGHFYIGNYILGVVKLWVQIFLCVVLWCTVYFACSKEHTFQTSYNEINNNDKATKNMNNEKKDNNEIKDENKDIFNENENYDNDSNENKNNNEYKNQSFELEENRESEIMFKKFISCPKSMFFIHITTISFFLFNIVDVCLIAFGVFKDENGEELYMWN